ncbi:MAG: hypothetical protein Q4D41_02950, partial [Prevotellaceae bacterium]|nr:hypothetical protein [Prevotellaceae bacterium]
FNCIAYLIMTMDKVFECETLFYIGFIMLIISAIWMSVFFVLYYKKTGIKKYWALAFIDINVLSFVFFLMFLI